MAKFFTLVVFNYIFGNGDAHLKNFSLQQTASGDYLLTPAYDLLNTSIHVDDSDFALQDGLMPKDAWSKFTKTADIPARKISLSSAKGLVFCLKR